MSAATAELPILARPLPTVLTEDSACSLTIATEDGYSLAATLWTAPQSRAVALIAPATGVPHGFYRRFARHLNAGGLDVLSFDYRGMSASRGPRSMRDPGLTMWNWGTRDLVAAIAEAERLAAGRPLVYVGHSFGGQALGLASNASRVERALFVGSQHGWMGHWPWHQRALLAFLWKLALPATTRLFGRFPSSLFGMGESLPREVALQWASWCSRREHLGAWEGHAGLRIPILSLSFEDDFFAPRAAAAALLREYASAEVEHRHLPAEGLGHFGFFRGGRVLALWDDAAQFLGS